MTEEFTIQCQNCGTFYNDLQDVCPYCGQPQPDPIADTLPAPPIIEEPSPPEPVAPYLPDPQPIDEALADDAYLPAEEDLLPSPQFADDDIFAVAGEPEPVEEYVDEYPDEYALYPNEYPAYYDPIDPQQPYLEYDDEEQVVDHPASSRFTWRRIMAGCLGTLVCLGLLYGGIGLVAVRQGLQERATIAQTESQQHYQKGLAHLTNNAIELAIAEFEQALSLNPNFPEARQALREACSKPTHPYLANPLRRCNRAFYPS